MTGQKFRIGIIVAICLTLCALTSCNEENARDENNNPIESVRRTVIVYMIANNSLGSNGCDGTDIDEMLEAAATTGFNGGRLLVYHAPASGNPALKEITSSGVQVLQEYDSTVRSTDPTRMKDVIEAAIKKAPADDYGLILWSHASAWVETASSKSIGENIAKPLAFGDDRGQHMKITSLAEALSGKHFRFIYFDCCHMASIEVAYELRHLTQYIIGSATEIPAAGMPYNINMPLFYSETPQLEQACRNTFNYYNSRNDYLRSCTISLIDTEHLDELAVITRDIFSSGTSTPPDYIPQQFVRGDACYSFDMAQYIHALTPDSATMSQWDNTLDKVVLYKAATPWILDLLKIETHCGLGCHIINDISEATHKGYNNQSWWKDVVSHHFTNL